MIECSGFSGAYNHLQGRLQLAASHLDISRAMLSVGYPSARSAATQVGLWRAILLFSLVEGYLDSRLRTTQYFRNLEPSEKASMSFLLGQAFTLWFAQHHMGLKYLVHVWGTGHTFTETQQASMMKPGAGPPKLRSRPDFIGRAPNQYHVFESKGRSSAISRSTISDALAQVSKIQLVNGVAPITRVAACFSFGASSSQGNIVDPEADKNPLKLDYDDILAARKFYTFFLEPEFHSSAEVAIPEFKCVRINDELIYGIDVKVLAALHELNNLTGESRSAEFLLNILRERQAFYIEQRREDVSIGNDGILLKGTNLLRRSSRAR